MKTLSFAFLAVMLSVPERAGSFTVTHGEDSGDGSLRHAIVSANAAAGADIITFGLKVFSVRVNTVLPVITGELTIDAVRPGSTDTNPPVEVVLTAESAGPAEALMDFSGSGELTVRGLALDHAANLAATLRVTSPGGTVLVERCRIGQNLTAQDSTGSGDRLLISGTVAQPLARFDVKQTTIRGSMQSAGVRVTDASEGNMDTVNITRAAHGIVLTRAHRVNTLNIGVGGLPSLVVSECHDGIVLSTCNDAMIGRYRITDNGPAGDGIDSTHAAIILRDSCRNCTVEEGILSRQNGHGLMVLSGCESCRGLIINSNQPVPDNICTGHAVLLRGAGITGFSLTSSYFPAYGGDGMRIESIGGPIRDIVIGSNFGLNQRFYFDQYTLFPTWLQAAILDPVPVSTGDGLHITGDVRNVEVNGGAFVRNARDGIHVGPGAGQVKLVRALLGANGGLDVNLAPAGEAPSSVTPNDSMDSDSGPNDLLNAPVITNVQITQPGSVAVGGMLDGLPSTAMTITLYGRFGRMNPAKFIEQKNLFTDTTGHLDFVFTALGAPGAVYFAHATSAGGQSSEFSPPVSLPAGSYRFSAPNYVVHEAGPAPSRSAQVVIERTGIPAAQTFMVDLVPVGASSSADIQDGSYSMRHEIVFATGDVSKSFTVTVVDDSLAEDAESFRILFQGASDTPVAPSMLTIVDDEAIVPAVTVADAILAEGDGGTATLTFAASIPAPADRPLSFAWTTVGQSATAGADFLGASGIASIAAGDTVTAITVTVAGDTLHEADEAVQLSFSAPSACNLARFSAIGTILNDDAAPEITIADTMVTEGRTADFTAWFKVSLNAVSGMPVSFHCATESGTASAGTDYESRAGSVTIAAGELSRYVGVTVRADAIDESDENFRLVISGINNASAVRSTAIGTITELRVLSFAPVVPNFYAVRFPSAVGQSYVIEEAAALDGPWLPNSGAITGTGTNITQVVFCDRPRCFLLVRATPAAPPGS